MDGSSVDVVADSLAQAMGILNEDLPECREMVVSWTGPTGIIFQMHVKNMRSHR